MPKYLNLGECRIENEIFIDFSSIDYFCSIRYKISGVINSFNN